MCVDRKAPLYAAASWQLLNGAIKLLYLYIYKILQVCLILQIVIYIRLCQLKSGKSSIIEELLATFHRQEEKLLGFWVFFVVLQWVTQKQMMVLVLENLVIFGTNIWNRFDRGSLHNPLVH